MRKPIIAGNWKMYKTFEEAIQFVDSLQDNLPANDKVDAVICAPALFLPTLVQIASESELAIGAQTMHYENEGAFTGRYDRAKSSWPNYSSACRLCRTGCRAYGSCL